MSKFSQLLTEIAKIIDKLSNIESLDINILETFFQ